MNAQIRAGSRVRGSSGLRARRTLPVVRATPVKWHRFQLRATPADSNATQVEQKEATPSLDGDSSDQNGTLTAAAPAALLSQAAGKQDTDVSGVDLSLKYAAPSSGDEFWTKFKLAFARPWRRFAKNSVLTIKLEGEVSDQSKGRFDPGNSLPQLCAALEKAAHDPRVAGLAIEIGPLACGYAKLAEIRRYLEYFKASGKFSVAYMKLGGEKEYYLASACQEVFAPPSASISLRGFVVGGTFLRGVLDKVGVEPQVQRIGAFKSAGDQLLRRDMSDAQREQLKCILDDTYATFVSTIAAARGKTEQEVRELLDAGVYDASQLLAAGWLDGLRYEDEVLADLKKRVGTPEDKMDKPLKKVGVRKMASVAPTTYAGLKSGGKKRIVVLRTAGAILGKASNASSGSITPDVLIPRLRALASDKNVAGVVLRVDSPGGDALASDLMWREVCKLGEKKPVIASMADVAASGGYYISMAAHKIIAEPLTVTGSIGVVTGKFNLSELYIKVGYAKELISRGKYAELLADNRPFNQDESELFESSAQHAYESFRNKAAASRRMEVDKMQAVAQGRVWTGQAALEQGLVDALGGVHAAVQLVKHAAGIAADEKVTVVEVGSARTSPLTLLLGSTAASAGLPWALSSPASMTAGLGMLLAPLLTGSVAPAAAAASYGAQSSSELGLGQAAGGVQAQLAQLVAAGVAPSLGMSAAQSVALAQVAGGALGVTLCVEPEVLSVQAAGSVAVAGVPGLMGISASGWAESNDELFLNE